MIVSFQKRKGRRKKKIEFYNDAQGSREGFAVIHFPILCFDYVDIQLLFNIIAKRVKMEAHNTMVVIY